MAHSAALFPAVILHSETLQKSAVLLNALLRAYLLCSASLVIGLEVATVRLTRQKSGTRRRFSLECLFAAKLAIDQPWIINSLNHED
jgi:hypothetical protein